MEDLSDDDLEDLSEEFSNQLPHTYDNVWTVCGVCAEYIFQYIGTVVRTEEQVIKRKYNLSKNIKKYFLNKVKIYGNFKVIY